MGGPLRTPGHATALISEIALVCMGHFLLDRTDKSARVFQRGLDGEGDCNSPAAIVFQYCLLLKQWFPNMFLDVLHDTHISVLGVSIVMS